jgi:transcriptional regulator with XRE-family HTH domain
MSDAVRGIAYPLFVRVERERALRGWSATRLHKETGVSRSTIGKWATQPQPPLASTVNAVADALGIERAEALRLAGILTDPPAAGAISDDELAGLERSLGVDLSMFEPDKRHALLIFAAALMASAERGREERRGA